MHYIRYIIGMCLSIHRVVVFVGVLLWMLLWKWVIVFVGLLYSMSRYAPEFMVCDLKLLNALPMHLHAVIQQSLVSAN